MTVLDTSKFDKQAEACQKKNCSRVESLPFNIRVSAKTKKEEQQQALLRTWSGPCAVNVTYYHTEHPEGKVQHSNKEHQTPKHVRPEPKP